MSIMTNDLIPELVRWGPCKDIENEQSPQNKQQIQEPRNRDALSVVEKQLESHITGAV